MTIPDTPAGKIPQIPSVCRLSHGLDSVPVLVWMVIHLKLGGVYSLLFRAEAFRISDETFVYLDLNRNSRSQPDLAIKALSRLDMKAKTKCLLTLEATPRSWAWTNIRIKSVLLCKTQIKQLILFNDVQLHMCLQGVLVSLFMLCWIRPWLESAETGLISCVDISSAVPTLISLYLNHYS